MCFIFLSFADQDIGSETSQQGMSEKVSIKSERIDLFTRDNSYFILELWQDSEQTGRYEENQNKPLSHTVFINKETLASEDYGYKDIVNTHFSPTKKKAL